MLVRQLKMLRRYMILLLIVMGGMVAYTYFVETGEVKVYFFDVGQGDASMISLPDGVQIIIDGGPDDGVVESIGEYLPIYDREIEYMVLTHPHSDHMIGLLALAERYTVNTFIYNSVDTDSDTFISLMNSLAEQGTTIVSVESPLRFLFSQNAVLDILYPDHILAPFEYEDLNDSSIVLKFMYKGNIVLFMGDAPMEVERYLLDKDINIEATILKIGHHGSNTATSADFIESVKPLYGVIMVGENSYGHPEYRVLKTLNDANVTILRTDEEGDIVLELSAEKVIRR